MDGNITAMSGQSLVPTLVKVREILNHYRLSAESITRCEHEGVANSVWFCGDYVLRVCKDPELLSDSYTESIAAPVAFATGIPTPRMICFDDDRRFIDSPFSIFEYVHGATLTETESLPDPQSFFSSLGGVVRMFHDAVDHVDDPDNFLDESWFPNPLETTDRARGKVPEIVADWVQERTPDFDRIRWTRGTFVHQDLHPSNILVHEGKLSAIIDWGDAGWGDASVDLRYVPATFVGAALNGYASSQSDFAQRVCVHVLDQYLYCAVTGKSYGTLCDSTWQEIEQLFSLHF